MKRSAFLNFEWLHDARWLADAGIPIRAQDDDVGDDDDVDELDDEDDDEEETDEDDDDDEDDDAIDDDELDEKDETAQQAVNEEAETRARDLEPDPARKGVVTSPKRLPRQPCWSPAVGIIRLKPDATR
jgi:hypothetical protein